MKEEEAKNEGVPVSKSEKEKQLQKKLSLEKAVSNVENTEGA